MKFNSIHWIIKLFSSERELNPKDDSAGFFLFVADVDYLLARFLVPTGLIHPIIFHAHQTLEKYLKAILVQETGMYPNTHSLKHLIKKASNTRLFTASEIETLIKKTKYLDRQYETSRYGGEEQYNFFVRIVQLFKSKSGKLSKIKPEEGFRVAGIIMQPPGHHKILDECVGIIRPKIKKTSNDLKKLIEGDMKNNLAANWRLKLDIRSIILSDNDNLDQLKL